jgi:hypothetical protein
MLQPLVQLNVLHNHWNGESACYVSNPGMVHQRRGHDTPFFGSS